MVKKKINISIDDYTYKSLLNAYSDISKLRIKTPDFNNIDNFSRFTDKIFQLGLNRVGYYIPKWT